MYYTKVNHHLKGTAQSDSFINDLISVNFISFSILIFPISLIIQSDYCFIIFFVYILFDSCLWLSTWKTLFNYVKFYILIFSLLTKFLIFSSIESSSLSFSLFPFSLSLSSKLMQNVFYSSSFSNCSISYEISCSIGSSFY